MKPRWTILVGIIPGPSELKLHINDFMTPLVNDLEVVRNGVEIVLPDGSIKLQYQGVACLRIEP